MRPHVAGAIKAGNSRQRVAAALVQVLPYIGGPYALSGLVVVANYDENASPRRPTVEARTRYGTGPVRRRGWAGPDRRTGASGGAGAGVAGWCHECARVRGSDRCQ